MAEASRPAAIPADEDDLAAVERVLSGHARAFESLVRKHERRVFRVALALLDNVEDAEEAMQDAFVKAFRHLGQFRRESRFTTWLTRIAINEALQKRKSQQSNISWDALGSGECEVMPRRYGAWQEDPERLYAKQELREIVEAAVGSLPPIYREAVVLRDLEGFTAEEAAQALGVEIAALKSRLFRGRVMLRETLAAAFEQPPTLKTRFVDTATRVRDAVAMRLMRAVGRQK